VNKTSRSIVTDQKRKTVAGLYGGHTSSGTVTHWLTAAMSSGDQWRGTLGVLAAGAAWCLCCHGNACEEVNATRWDGCLTLHRGTRRVRYLGPPGGGGGGAARVHVSSPGSTTASPALRHRDMHHMGWAGYGRPLQRARTIEKRILPCPRPTGCGIGRLPAAGWAVQIQIQVGPIARRLAFSACGRGGGVIGYAAYAAPCVWGGLAQGVEYNTHRSPAGRGARRPTWCSSSRSPRRWPASMPCGHDHSLLLGLSIHGPRVHYVMST
jgi:hypothetical protein